MKRLWRNVRRHWRLTEMQMLFWALLVSVMAVSSVGFFTDRVDRAMSSQATHLMGGDLVLRSSRPISRDYLALAEKQQVKAAEAISFPSMVTKDDDVQLAMIKAITEQYPLYGALRAATDLDGADADMSILPKSGEAWAEPRIFLALKAKPGDTVFIGNSKVRLTHVLTHEPSRSGDVFQFAPIVLMPMEDLKATGLLTPASRASFKLFMTGKEGAIADLNDALEPLLKPAEEITSLQDGVPSVQEALQRAGRFLGLAALLSVILAGAGIALASSTFMRKETRSVAVLKVMGMSRREVLLDYLSSLLITAFFASLIGIILGFIIQAVLANWAASLVMDIALPQPSLTPILYGFLTAFIMVLGFSLPYLLQLVDTPPVHILKSGMVVRKSMTGIFAVLLLAAVFCLLWLQAKDITLAAMLLAGVVLGLAVFWAAGKALLHGLSLLGLKGRWRWLSNLRRSPRSVMLVVVFGIGFFSLLLMTMVRTELLYRWQQSVPDNAPNHFLINVQPTELDAMKNYLKDESIEANLFPMVRGRLVAINDKAVSAKDYSSGREKGLLQREFNLSAAQAELPESNKLVEGEWFANEDAKGFSVEVGVGKRLGFGMGDTLTFDIAGERFTETVTSLREVRWDSMQPNFFVLSGPKQFDAMSRTYMTGVYVPESKKGLISSLVKQFPSVTSLDVGAILDQVKKLINQATMAIQGIFIFTLIAGIVVLMTALQSQKTDRRKEIAVYKSMGMSQSDLRFRLLVEFMMLGALAGGLAGLLVMVVGNVLSSVLFDLEVSVIVWPMISGIVLGALLVGGVGYWALRHLLVQSPTMLLKEG